MGLSWHNFFFGAFEPGGSVSIDKPPVDLWLQVASVKLLGFSSTTLKLPEALAGIAAVPLLFAAVQAHVEHPRGARRGASALAVLPVEVITSRSDTMDGVMMALIVLALWLIVRACESGRYAWLLAGAAALGDRLRREAAGVARRAPGLALLAYLGLPGPAQAAPAADAGGRRGVRGGRAGVADGDAAGSRARPPVRDRLDERQRVERRVRVQRDRPSRRQIARTAADGLPARPPLPRGDPVRARPHPDRARPRPRACSRESDRCRASGSGLELLVALLLGVPALICGAAGRQAQLPRSPRPRRLRRDDEARAARLRRMRRAVAAGLSLWTLTGIALFSDMIRLHPRYVEGFMPAVAALLGIGVAWAGRQRSAIRRQPGAPDRADRGARGDRVLRRAPAVRARRRLVDHARRRARRDRVRAASLALGPREAGSALARLLGGATIALTLVAVLRAAGERGRHARSTTT